MAIGTALRRGICPRKAYEFLSGSILAAHAGVRRREAELERAKAELGQEAQALGAFTYLERLRAPGQPTR